ncbi:MAG TPA: hypothetical protein VNN73_19370 [Blastocatellia bacterium]|nr:hypothetical protein [Blastocatellia bacterium]
MKGLYKKLISLSAAALLMAVLIGANSAFAKTSNSPQRRLVGVVVSVDKDARSLIVREFHKETLTAVKVPYDRPLRVSSGQQDFISFDRIKPGMIINENVRQ